MFSNFNDFLLQDDDDDVFGSRGKRKRGNRPLLRSYNTRRSALGDPSASKIRKRGKSDSVDETSLFSRITPNKSNKTGKKLLTL